MFDYGMLTDRLDGPRVTGRMRLRWLRELMPTLMKTLRVVVDGVCLRSFLLVRGEADRRRLLVKRPCR